MSDRLSEREAQNEVKRGDYTPEETRRQIAPKRSTRKLIDQRLSLGLLARQGHTTGVMTFVRRYAGKDANDPGPASVGDGGGAFSD
jgi:hypothetical protein